MGRNGNIVKEIKAWSSLSTNTTDSQK
jgi:hypothetical protein